MIDIGINLTHKSYDRDRDEVIARAVAAGVTTLVITGTSVEESRAAAEMARGRAYSTAGVHPHNAKECDDGTIAALRAIAGVREVRAIGECGLDFNRNFSSHEDQERWFEAQLELAVELKLPVFLHERDAAERMLAILTRYRSRLVGGVVHCFTGGRAIVEQYLGLDLHIGITGWICDERRGADLNAAAPAIPLDRLMIETDGPYLLPRAFLPWKPADGRRNEPAFLPAVVKGIARATGRDEAEIATETTRTARRFFGL